VTISSERGYPGRESLQGIASKAKQEFAAKAKAIVIDGYSRRVAGYHLGFEPPSSLRTTLALRQGSGAKVIPTGDLRDSLCSLHRQRFGVSIEAPGASSIFDQSGLGMVLTGMPEIEKRVARYPQFFSRIGPRVQSPE
jgi:hypothetical protein